MRVLALLAAGIAVAALSSAAPAQKARDWRQTVTQAPSGAFVMGNPAARVKLAEYLSYTCSHCAHFAAESRPVLKDRLVRTGQVQMEYRHAIRDGLDLAAAMLARYTGPRQFVAATETIFAHQDALLAKAKELPAATGSRAEKLRAMAEGSGLVALLQPYGMTSARASTCLANEAELKKLLAMTESAFARIQGTPSFEINGELVPGVFTWDALQPRLAAAGAS